ncbi:hypothetical protein E1A91_A07G035600v1 [Gossypium mustelinum]|uniref:Uncharacterized protein n=2 Tax=Gossypium TaxID=3633 RepID=A0A5D2YGR2_GOSMU|nr:hypothetical protein ES332_A07G036200v1 [Gossypium tomentosum]TYJ25244.1 hypothetical protein E1A91_A07G035600v1 [Gossypium mustelinum]
MFNQSYSAETMVDDQSVVVGKELCNLQCKDLGLSRTAVWKMDVQNSLNNIQNSPCSVSKVNVYNRITGSYGLWALDSGNSLPKCQHHECF